MNPQMAQCPKHKPETVLEVDCGDGSAALWMYFIPWNRTLKNGLKGKFYVMGVSLQLKKKKERSSVACF